MSVEWKQCNQDNKKHNSILTARSQPIHVIQIYYCNILTNIDYEDNQIKIISLKLSSYLVVFDEWWMTNEFSFK